jgi:two-component system cell cycle sensor histidine kinase/response regulator CckA
VIGLAGLAVIPFLGCALENANGMKKTAPSSRAAHFPDESQQTGPWPAEMCRRAIESAPWPMFVLDCELKRVVEANDAAIARYQMNRDELQLRGVDQLLSPDRRTELDKLLDARLDGPPPDTYSEHILPDRTVLPVEIHSFPLLWNDRPSRFFIVRDLLARPPRARDHVLSEKLDLTGGLSGSVAHDFNNLLTVILAVAEQLQEGEGDPEQKINLIAKTVRNAQQLARQRLSLGGSHESRRERIDLNVVLDEQADTLGVLLGKQVNLKLDFEAELWPVLADAAQWREVILNLAVNARDAMPEGGSFSISTRNESLDTVDPGQALPRGRYIHLVVQDTGHGMTEETRLHAFEPYFTTKSRNRNSGLGLASVHSVVEQCGGDIHLTSAPGKGTRFDIFIPALAEAQMAPAGGLVLLVEDAEELRRMIQDFLTARGYEVVACATAEVALKWARTHDRGLDLVICDLTLPDLPGDMLVEQLREQHSETRAIFMSGQLGIGDAILSPPGVAPAPCLEKPFSLHQLAAAVSEALGREVHTP